MKLGKRRPSASMIVATIALVAALAGGAYAATKIQTSDIAKRAVTTKKLDGKAVTSGKLAGNAVKTAKLTAAERSQAYITNTPGATNLPAGTSTTVATLNLPTGFAYVLSAQASLGNNAATANLANCELRDDGVTVSAGNGALPALAVFAETITLVGSSDGGAVTLACQLENAGQARNRVITATQAGSLLSP